MMLIRSIALVTALLVVNIAHGGDEATLRARLAQIDAKLAELKTSTYTTGAEQACATGKPLIVYLGVQPRAVAGAVTAHTEVLAGYSAPAVIVCVPGEGWLVHRATLPAGASDAQIAAALAPKGVQALPAPFFQGKDADGNVPPTVVGEVQDALAAVNATRAQRGLRAYLRDDGLTAGALRIAAHRAERRMYGHTANDFGFLDGCTATVGGCAGATPDWGWLACATYENWTYCGAAWVLGSDGRLYCHAFYR